MTTTKQKAMDTMDRFALVLKATAPWRELHKDTDFAELVECPACKGRLHLSIVKHNNHVWGECETEGCVKWME